MQSMDGIVFEPPAGIVQPKALILVMILHECWLVLEVMLHQFAGGICISLWFPWLAGRYVVSSLTNTQSLCG